MYCYKPVILLGSRFTNFLLSHGYEYRVYLYFTHLYVLCEKKMWHLLLMTVVADTKIYGHFPRLQPWKGSSRIYVLKSLN